MNANMKMRAWYENHFIQLFHADASARTVVEYQATLNLWEILTANKPIGEISSLDIANFRAALAKLPGRKCAITSPVTVNKHLRHLNHLFGKAGPTMFILALAPGAPGHYRLFRPTAQAIGQKQGERASTIATRLALVPLMR